MTKWFCPYCWYELKEEDNVCSNCGADLSGFSILSYDEKLILGLKSPITQNRMFVIYVLGKRKVSMAIYELCKMLSKEKDTYELLEIIKAMLAINREEAKKCLKKADLKENTIIRRYLEQNGII